MGDIQFLSGTIFAPSVPTCSGGKKTCQETLF
jgi:hypothetical protein